MVYLVYDEKYIDQYDYTNNIIYRVHISQGIQELRVIDNYLYWSQFSEKSTIEFASCHCGGDMECLTYRYNLYVENLLVIESMKFDKPPESLKILECSNPQLTYFSYDSVSSSIAVFEKDCNLKIWPMLHHMH